VRQRRRWRLPSRNEPFSIVNLGTEAPAIDTNFLSNMPNDGYWSSDIYAPDPGKAWFVVLL
jgi:hypothetical protein